MALPEPFLPQEGRGALRKQGEWWGTCDQQLLGEGTKAPSAYSLDTALTGLYP
jgi:hypothetical protein